MHVDLPSHSAHWLPARKKLLYTVANPARGLLNREKKKKKKSGSTPCHCSSCRKLRINEYINEWNLIFNEKYCSEYKNIFCFVIPLELVSNQQLYIFKAFLCVVRTRQYCLRKLLGPYKSGMG